jgi:hypothetical protein
LHIPWGLSSLYFGLNIIYSPHITTFCISAAGLLFDVINKLSKIES